MSRQGRKSAAQTPAPQKERVYGSDKNPVGSAASQQSASKIQLSESITNALKKKVEDYNERHKKKVSLATAKAVMRRGMGAYSKSHRPTITGGAPNSRQAWGYARFNKFLKKKSGEPVKKAYVQDDDLLAKGGQIKKLSPEQIKLVKSASFKKWFGDWEKEKLNKFDQEGDLTNLSVTEDGTPRLWYHARYGDFSKFQKDTAYFATTEDYAEQYGSVTKEFFVKCRKTLNLGYVKPDLAYTFDILADEIVRQGGKKEGKDYEMLKSNYEKLSDENSAFLMWEYFTQYNPWIKYWNGWLGKYFDSVYYQELGKRTKNNRGWMRGPILYIFGENIASRIKLADGSNKTFDPNNPDIRYDMGAELPVGKLAKGMNLSQVAAHHGLSAEHLKAELNNGIQTELEHTDDPAIARAIALDHLYEDPGYYTKLKKIEKPVTKERVSSAIKSVLDSPNKSAERASLWKRLQDKRASMADGGEFIDNLDDYLKDNVYKDPNKSSRWRVKGNNYTYSSKKEASMVAERVFQRELFARKNPRNNSQMAEGGNVIDANGVETNDGKKGGYFKGRSHAEGGIKAFNVDTNTPIEVEGDEVIITKKAVRDPKKRSFEGQMLTNREILSKINQSGGGVAFDKGGETEDCGCNEYESGGTADIDLQMLSCKDIENLNDGLLKLNAQAPHLYDNIIEVLVHLKKLQIIQNC